MSTDNRTPAEIAYDNLKTGAAYVRPNPSTEVDDKLTRLLEEVESWYSPAPVERRHAARLVDQALGTTDDAPAVRETHNWHDTTQDGDLCDEPRGPLAYTNYLAGSKDADNLCEISFPVSLRERPVVYMLGRDEVDLERVVRTLDSLLALLADPRVQALRAARHAPLGAGQ
jgi:hypothetical protein